MIIPRNQLQIHNKCFPQRLLSFCHHLKFQLQANLLIFETSAILQMQFIVKIICIQTIYKISHQEMISKLITISFLLVAALCSTGDVDWNDQQNWEGVCTTGTAQSPINILPPTAKYCLTTQFDFVQFQCKDFVFSEGYGQTDHIEAQDAVFVMTDTTIDGTHFRAIAATSQFHFHSPSEHTINGEHYELEMHIVSEPIDTARYAAAIDVMEIEEKTSYTKQGLKEKFLANDSPVTPPEVVLGYMFEVSDEASEHLIINADGNVNLFNLLDCTSDNFFYRYSGSLTTPPCTEGVQWLVSRKPIKISQSEMNIIKGKIESSNNRNIQALNGRTLILTGAPCYPS